MGELAYMIRADWAQQATAMVPQSEVIRNWVGTAPYLFAVPNIARFHESTRNLEREVADFIAPEGTERSVHSIANFGELRNTDTVVERCVIVVHPRQREDVETLRELVDDGKLLKVFVLIWWMRTMCVPGWMRTVHSTSTAARRHRRPTRSWSRPPG